MPNTTGRRPALRQQMPTLVAVSGSLSRIDLFRLTEPDLTGNLFPWTAPSSSSSFSSSSSICPLGFEDEDEDEDEKDWVHGTNSHPIFGGVRFPWTVPPHPVLLPPWGRRCPEGG